MGVYDLESKLSLNSKEFKEGLKAAGVEFQAFAGKVKDGAAKLAKLSAATFTAVAGAATARNIISIIFLMFVLSFVVILDLIRRTKLTKSVKLKAFGGSL